MRLSRWTDHPSRGHRPESRRLAVSPPTRTLSLARRRLALVIVCTAALMVILDGTIVTVALPAIQAGLGFTPEGLSWVMTGYLITFGGLLLLSGRLGDLLGRKRVFLAGIAVFAAASLACGLATTPGIMLAARFAQGGGAAMTSAVTLALVVRLFDDPAGQGRAIGAFAFTGAVGASAGLVLGGLLVQYANWHWIFFVNLPVGAVTWLAAWRVLPADLGAGLRAGADWPGAALATGAVMLAVLALARPSDWWAALVAAALLAAFAVRQATARSPLLPPRVLASRTVVGANLVQLLIIGAALGFQVITTLYLQRVLRFGPAAAGLGFAPTALAIAVVSLGLSARLTARFGARRLLLAGLALITAALALLTAVHAHSSYVTRLLPAFALFGIGGGLALPAVTTLGMSGATEEDAGILSGVFNTVQQVGGALGIAALTALAAARTGGGTSAQALTAGYHLAWATGTAIGAASIVTCALLLRERHTAPAVTAQDPVQEAASRSRRAAG